MDNIYLFLQRPIEFSKYCIHIIDAEHKINFEQHIFISQSKFNNKNLQKLQF